MAIKRICDETGEELRRGWTLTSDWSDDWNAPSRHDFKDIDALTRHVMRMRARYAGTAPLRQIVQEIEDQIESHNATPTQHETATSAEKANETDS